ncbi:hypothetical protein SNOG_06028 [Parastagonospora nodorum SN15]|uniref:Epoxide hydrolase N-terminal domain-containing protein n=1 Tax=Phaeosphaeria nodorum (strain SN15 / ATCC MYA-4574 / FGSC 10173) TaxID=321614 RepID=Q0UQD6_PHANO|nr:hypothetical protein SNOG_06028 [Parastagonospora nodorum SN15]EAT87092.1 hypothetical protein SNOG_06028 [Parastagonospora nodorum SN15]
MPHTATPLEDLDTAAHLRNIPSDRDDCEPWLHGPPSRNIKRLTQHWAHEYEWRKAEAQFNE